MERRLGVTIEDAHELIRSEVPAGDIAMNVEEPAESAQEDAQT